MGFFNKLFKPTPEPGNSTPAIDKAQVPVYPMIKSAEWPGTGMVVNMPFVRINEHPDLAIVFAQDAGDRFEYLTPPDLEKAGVPENYSKWQSNIDAYPYEIVPAKSLDSRVLTASGPDHAAEKILSLAFLAEACKALRTDKLIISAPRRRCLMITSYHEDFQLLEDFFRLHFNAWRDDTYGNELITEMVFLADAGKVTHAVPLGFRINVYEKDGRYTLSYSTTDDLFGEHDQIDFQAIMERNKIPVSL